MSITLPAKRSAVHCLFTCINATDLGGELTPNNEGILEAYFSSHYYHFLRMMIFLISG